MSSKDFMSGKGNVFFTNQDDDDNDNMNPQYSENQNMQMDNQMNYQNNYPNNNQMSGNIKGFNAVPDDLQNKVFSQYSKKKKNKNNSGWSSGSDYDKDEKNKTEFDKYGMKFNDNSNNRVSSAINNIFNNADNNQYDMQYNQQYVDQNAQKFFQQPSPQFNPGKSHFKNQTLNKIEFQAKKIFFNVKSYFHSLIIAVKNRDFKRVLPIAIGVFAFFFVIIMFGLLSTKHLKCTYVTDSGGLITTTTTNFKYKFKKIKKFKYKVVYDFSKAEYGVDSEQIRKSLETKFSDAKKKGCKISYNVTKNKVVVTISGKPKYLFLVTGSTTSNYNDDKDDLTSMGYTCR